MAIKVIQWATGTIGTAALKEIIRHPDTELVGLKVYSPAKNGLDAGDLCGMPKTGVRATTSTEEILKLDADVVLHMPKAYGVLDECVDDICALLESGNGRALRYEVRSKHGHDSCNIVLIDALPAVR